MLEICIFKYIDAYFLLFALGRRRVVVVIVIVALILVVVLNVLDGVVAHMC